MMREHMANRSHLQVFYKDDIECFEDRINHRKAWFDTIAAFNTPNKTATAEAVLKESDIYVGMRNRAELAACRHAGLFDIIVWVDASLRVDPEAKSSCTVEPWMADWIIDNNGDTTELAVATNHFFDHVIDRKH